MSRQADFLIVPRQICRWTDVAQHVAVDTWRIWEPKTDEIWSERRETHWVLCSQIVSYCFYSRVLRGQGA